MPTRVLGIDCSRWQDNNSTPQQMDFEKAYDAGARFVFVKASQGTWADEDFLWNWKSAKDAGLYRGAYHYLDNSARGYDQAEFFMGLMKQDPGELPFVLDYEYRSSPPGMANFEEWIQHVLGFYDKRPMVYTSPYYWQEYGSGNYFWETLPLWIANYEVNEPDVPAPWDRWTFWQYTSKGDGKAFGAESQYIDLNWYNGDWDQFVKEFGEIGGVQPPTGTYWEGYRDALMDTIDFCERELDED